VGTGGLEEPPPSKPAQAPLKALQAALAASLPQLAPKTASAAAAAAGGSELPAATAGPPLLTYYPRPFEFLSLGLLAYVGNDKALTQLEAFDSQVG
jgi:NADH:ubiquinone reductase (non-electrogenic)